VARQLNKVFILIVLPHHKLIRDKSTVNKVHLTDYCLFYRESSKVDFELFFRSLMNLQSTELLERVSLQIHSNMPWRHD